ncbi:hypothetical protein BDZ94DRAFT_615735 [Collybia nuda]|uniref:Uncharacterized protein n=1 Tax=Collybia nuda TaxID=64659 RepID=A0A9P6CK80_9AGAR|nr:hypothetical protein BDZ94DRAFT_615735 [Collybia nuda]
MLSSIASFLPSALHLSSGSNNSNPVLNPTDNPIEEEAYQQPVEEDLGAKKGPNASKPRNANETFIFVRPPPAKSNHPLNLQVQLVPPASRAPQHSLDEPDTPITLTRTASNRSDTSSYGSTASFSSTASSASGRRTIIPLYNLQAHNVMTNTIVDAGTDAKIAKFQRRGIELIDLAILEPVEVWGERPRPAKASRPATPDPVLVPNTAGSSSASLSSSNHIQQPQPQLAPILQSPPVSAAPSRRNIFGKLFKKSGKDATPPPSPAVSTFSPSATPTQRSIDPAATPIANRPDRSHTRNLSAALSPTNFTGRMGGRDRSSSPNPQLVGLGLTVTSDDMSTNTSNTSSTDLPNPEEKILRPPVLGIQPTLSFSFLPTTNGPPPVPLPAASLAKNARALMYVWFVRKWLKRRARPFNDEEGGNGIMGIMRESARGAGSMMGVGGSTVTADGVEVRFEWKRSTAGKKGKRKELERRGRGSFVTSEGGDDRDREKIREKDRERREPSVKDRLNRLSVVSHQSISTTISISEDGHSPSRRGQGSRSGTPTRGRKISPTQTPVPQKDGERDRDEDPFDAGEESDPEDSETPWVCTLKIRRAGAPNSPPGSTRGSARGTGNGIGNGYRGVGREGDEVGVLATAQPQVLRIKVGTLSPTPHHPKVVAMLKVPFPLPDVEVERMGVNRRPVGQPNARPPTSHQWSGTTLTAEEIKDIVCSTGLWLVVREGFGGVGKVSRKGDGWRIRA